CIPSKALITAGDKFTQAKGSDIFGITTENVQIDWAKTQKWKQEQVVDRLTGGVEMLLKKNKVEIIMGEAFFSDSNTVRVMGDEFGQTYTFNNAIIATGSRPIELGAFKWSDRVLDSTGALALDEIPNTLTVIGGGYIGSELAGVFAGLGTKVTILEGMDSIVNGFDKDMVRLVENEFKNNDATIITKAMAKSVSETDKDATVTYEVNGKEETDKDATVTYEVNGKEETVTSDYVLVTVGRRPNTDEIGLELAGVELDDRGLIQVDNQGRSVSNKNIFAIGDVVPGAALAHKAS